MSNVRNIIVFLIVLSVITNAISLEKFGIKTPPKKAKKVAPGGVKDIFKAKSSTNPPLQKPPKTPPKKAKKVAPAGVKNVFKTNVSCWLLIN